MVSPLAVLFIPLAWERVLGGFTHCPSVRDPEVRVIGFDFDALDGLDRVRDVGVVGERAVPGGEAVSIRDLRWNGRCPTFLSRS